MFKRVITHRGFLKSVLILGLVYGVVLFLLHWAFNSFQAPFLSFSNICIALLSGLVAGLFISYGKFWGKLKQKDHRK